MKHKAKCQKSLNSFPQNIGTQTIFIIRESQYNYQIHVPASGTCITICTGI